MTRPNTMADFWTLVDRSAGPGACWLWRGTIHKTGYGLFKMRGAKWYAHRLMYLSTYGFLTPGLDVLHSCDNPPCVNPAHLHEGTHQENMNERTQRGRAGWLGKIARNAKLLPPQREEVRQRYAAGGITQQALAREYGCDERVIWNCVNGRKR